MRKRATKNIPRTRKADRDGRKNEGGLVREVARCGDMTTD